MKRSTVGQVMTSDVISVRPGAEFRDVAAVLAEHHISGVPVVDEDNRVIGIVTEADLIAKEKTKTAVQEPQHPRHLLETRRQRLERARQRVKAAGSTAEDVMTSPVLTVHSDTPVVEAARLFSDTGHKCLPVVTPSNELIGIVSRADLVRIFLKPDAQIRREVIREVIMRSLWQDPADFHVEVHNGVVTLRGEIELASLVPIAEHLTNALDGVVKVHNELTYDRDDTTPEAQRYHR